MTAKRRFLIAVALLAAAALVAALWFPRLRPSVQPHAEISDLTQTESADKVSLEPPPELAETEIRQSLEEVCSARTGAVDKAAPSDDEVADKLEEYEDTVRSIAERLKVSAKAGHLHFAALLQTDKSSAIELITKALSHNPDDAYLVWDAVRLCADAADEADCPMRQWEDRLLAVDGQNSESWVRVAANRYGAGDYDAALQAMRHASTAAESRAYWAEAIEMGERGLAAWSDYPFLERASMAVGFAVTRQPRYGDYVTMCKERSAQNVDWAYVCLAYGELVENQGKTMMGVAIARSIQKIALEALGEFEQSVAVERRMQARRQETRVMIGDRFALTMRLILSHPALFSSYLAAVRSRGEMAAQRHLAREFERLLAQQPELACDSF